MTDSDFAPNVHPWGNLGLCGNDELICLVGNSRLQGPGGAEMETMGCATEARGGSSNKSSADGEDFEAFDFLCLFFFIQLGVFLVR